MTKHLPPSLLALFAPRPPLPYLPPVEKPRCPPYEGVANFLQFFEDPSQVDYSKFTPVETSKQKRVRRKREKLARKEKEIQDGLQQWDPQENQNATGDAYKTLFVSRINYQTSETKLKREFELYGPIKKIRMIKDKDGKPRGYAFIEYERERDMKAAFKAADGKKIDGRRVLVDVERGRTVKNWRPRKFGGGLGGTRLGGEDVNQKFSGREPPAIAATTVAPTTGKSRSDSVTPRGSNPPSGSSTPRDNPPHQRDNRGYRGPERDRDRDRDRERFGHHRDHHRDQHHRESRDVRERDRDGRMVDRERFDIRGSGGAPPPPPAGERFDRSRDHKKRKRSRSRSRSRSRERERERDPTDDDYRDY